MRGKSIMGLDFSKFDDSEEEEIPELVKAENDDQDFFEDRPSKKASRKSVGNVKKSKRVGKAGKKTRKQVRFD